jgi:hypothetical protein
MDAAKGGVLFIDEAYALGKGGYGEEAMTKLLGMLTEPEYKGKMVVILAGYADQMNIMMERNPGFKSRFKELIHFRDWDGSQCCRFILEKLQKSKPLPYVLPQDPKEVQEIVTALTEGMNVIKERPGWANIRDAETMIELVENQVIFISCTSYIYNYICIYIYIIYTLLFS